MSNVTITDEEGNTFSISILRYALAVRNKSLALYTIIAMLAGGILTLLFVLCWMMGSAVL